VREDVQCKKSSFALLVGADEIRRPGLDDANDEFEPRRLLPKVSSRSAQPAPGWRVGLESPRLGGRDVAAKLLGLKLDLLKPLLHNVANADDAVEHPVLEHRQVPDAL